MNSETKVVIIVGTIIIIGVSIALFLSFKVYNFNEKIKKDISLSEKNWIISNYDSYSKYFENNDNGDYLLSVINFNKEVNGVWFASWHVNDDFDLCLGNYIIKKQSDGNIIVDDTHICDFIE